MKKYAVLIFALFSFLTLHAQETLPVTGGDATGSGGSSAYTVGQSVYTTNSGMDGSSVQGIQYAIEVSVMENSLDQALYLTAMTYPNPTAQKIILSLKNSDLTDLSFVLHDIYGKAIKIGRVLPEETIIDISILEMGVYLLKVNRYNTGIKNFKIIKTKL